MKQNTKSLTKGPSTTAAKRVVSSTGKLSILEEELLNLQQQHSTISQELGNLRTKREELSTLVVPLTKVVEAAEDVRRALEDELSRDRGALLKLQEKEINELTSQLQERRTVCSQWKEDELEAMNSREESILKANENLKMFTEDSGECCDLTVQSIDRVCEDLRNMSATLERDHEAFLRCAAKKEAHMDSHKTAVLTMAMDEAAQQLETRINKVEARIDDTKE